jgi:hypothetical protein
MKNEQRAVRSTIILGGLAALVWFLAASILAWHRYWPWAAFGIIWLTTSAYAFMLVQWSGRRFAAVLFPLLVLALIGVVMPRSVWASGIVIALLGWIRSGVCFPQTVGQSVGRELALGGGGGIAILWWGPSTALSGALCLWLFSLIQALFFILFEPEVVSSSAGSAPDPFDRAARRVEDLLAGL